MIEPDRYWVSTESKIDDIFNPQDIIIFDWTGTPSEDYIKLSELFYKAAQTIVTEIIDDFMDNAKCDEWFFPALYLYRQAIELLCKGLLITVIPRKNIAEKLKTYKHNIIDLFNEYLNLVTDITICNDELTWVDSYLTDLEIIDKSSSLFRYPIKDGYLKQYRNKFLDMSNSIDQCYAIIYKLVSLKHNPLKYANNIDLSLKANVLFFSSHGTGNCMLYSSPWDEGYYPQIEGYSNVAYFLSKKLKKNHWSFMSIAFLIRHAIELTVKYMLLSRTEICVSPKIQKKKRNSHVIYTELWKTVKNMILYYANESGYDLNVINIADTYLSSLSSLDSKGYNFRYPTNYNLQYSLKLKKIDYCQAISWLLSIFNCVKGCADMLNEIYECECNMKSAL